MFAKVISEANLQLAYLKIVKLFASEQKDFKYHGLDSLLLNNYDLNSRDLISLVREELILKKDIDPALSIKIPKKNKPKKFREIFIYNLRERVKAQAIFQVVSPEFEKHFSDRLFSYRPGKPPHLAAKNFSRRYKRSFKEDYALILDLENYSDLINKEILVDQLEKIFFDNDILDLLRLFIFNKVYRQGIIEQPSFGLVQGVPLIALFANLYLSDIDFKYQKLAPFYIRVGDDIAILDKFPEKLEKIQINIISDLTEKKLTLNHKKMYLGPAVNSFSFLGYSYLNGLISLEKNYINRIKLDWKSILNHKHLPDKQKDRLLKKIMSEPKNNFNYKFEQIIRDKPQINDSDQVKKFSEDFFKILTKFFYLQFSPRNRRLLESRLASFRIISLYNFYKKFHYERATK